MQTGKNLPLVNGDGRVQERRQRCPSSHQSGRETDRQCPVFSRPVEDHLRSPHHHTGEIFATEWGMRYWITAPYEEPPELFRMYGESGREVIHGNYPQLFAYICDRFA
jgi:hypothetical protein